MNDDNVNAAIRNFVRTHPDIQIDRYSPKGGFGELYFGTRNVLNDRVALKFYQLDGTSGNHAEPQFLIQIKHDHILPIFDARILDSTIAYYLTPEISGGDLQNFINTHVITTNTAIDITQKILSALTELHRDSMNMVHMDIKTGNILIEENDGRPFLADFGTIKQIPNNVDHVSISQFSPLYRPPEAIVNNRYYKQSDLYQLGIVLFQMLGGFFPLGNLGDWIRGKNRKKFEKLGPSERKTFLTDYIDTAIVKGKLIDCIFYCGVVHVSPRRGPKILRLLGAS